MLIMSANYTMTSVKIRKLSLIIMIKRHPLLFATFTSYSVICLYLMSYKACIIQHFCKTSILYDDLCCRHFGGFIFIDLEC